MHKYEWRIEQLHAIKCTSKAAGIWYDEQRAAIEWGDDWPESWFHRYAMFSGNFDEIADDIGLRGFPVLRLNGKDIHYCGAKDIIYAAYAECCVELGRCVERMYTNRDNQFRLEEKYIDMQVRLAEIARSYLNRLPSMAEEEGQPRIWRGEFKKKIITYTRGFYHKTSFQNKDDAEASMDLTEENVAYYCYDKKTAKLYYKGSQNLEALAAPMRRLAAPVSVSQENAFFQNSESPQPEGGNLVDEQEVGSSLMQPLG